MNANNGELRWEVEAQEPVLGAVTIDNGIVYIGASDHTFRAIDLYTGKIKWTYTGVKGYIETRPLIEEDKVILEHGITHSTPSTRIPEKNCGNGQAD